MEQLIGAWQSAVLVDNHRNWALVKFAELSVLEHLILEQFAFVYCCYCLCLCESVHLKAMCPSGVEPRLILSGRSFKILHLPFPFEVWLLLKTYFSLLTLGSLTLKWYQDLKPGNCRMTSVKFSVRLQESVDNCIEKKKNHNDHLCVLSEVCRDQPSGSDEWAGPDFETWTIFSPVAYLNHLTASFTLYAVFKTENAVLFWVYGEFITHAFHLLVTVLTVALYLMSS